MVGARKFLIAYNINLRSEDLSLAQSIARRIRSSGGGLPEVKALGLPLVSRGLVQVSMNLTDFEVTPPTAVYAEVERMCAASGIEIEESELIGLIPARAIDLKTAARLKIKHFDPGLIIETRIAACGPTQ